MSMTHEAWGTNKVSDNRKHGAQYRSTAKYRTITSCREYASGIGNGSGRMGLKKSCSGERVIARGAVIESRGVFTEAPDGAMA